MDEELVVRRLDGLTLAAAQIQHDLDVLGVAFGGYTWRGFLSAQAPYLGARLFCSSGAGPGSATHRAKTTLSCRPCGRPFTEPVPGILKGYRSTERYRRSLLWACENFSDLTQVRRAYRCSSGYRPHQRSHRGLQQQGEARKEAGLRL